MAHRIARVNGQIRDWAWKFLPISMLIGIVSFVIANQILSPHRRIVKIFIGFLLLVIMLRLEMVYSLYLFIVLMPFPSGIFLSSTNVVLMTAITLLWAIRASSMKMRLIEKTDLDPYIILFIGAHMISFLSVETTHHIIEGIRIFWRELTAIAFFYLIVRFVDDERKLNHITKVIALSAGLLAFTGMFELFAPGRALIPGWIILSSGYHGGELTGRLLGLRLGGAVASHSLLSDFLSISMFFIAFHLLRSSNPVEKLLWLVILAMAFVVTLATANRGAFISLLFGIGYSLIVFRRYLNLIKYVVIVSLLTSMFIAGQLVLDKYTYTASITQRMVETQFFGVVPDTRVGIWLPALEGSKEHIFIGHGPFYDIGTGLEFKPWPHNSYIFTLYTLGLLGLVPFLMMRYKLFRFSFEYARGVPKGTLAQTLMGIFHVQLCMHFLQVFRTDFQRSSDYVYVFIVWMLFGLIVAARRILRKKDLTLAQHPPEA